MTAPADVIERFNQLQLEVSSFRLFALVDGIKYQSFNGRHCTRSEGFHSLFEGTADAILAHAGPWLIDTGGADDETIESLVQLELAEPAVTWLISAQSVLGLVQMLQLNLDAKLPDGRVALIRFWDPRVLVNVAQVLDGAQREMFFAHIHEWHLLHNGQRTWIGRPNATAQ